MAAVRTETGPEEHVVAAADAAPSALRRELFRAAFTSGAYVLADGLARGVSLGLTLLYTRFLLPGEFGPLALASTVTLLLVPVLGLSVSSGVSRLHFEAVDEAERRRLYASSLGFLLVVPTALLGAVEVLGDAGALDFLPGTPYAPYLRYAVLAAYFGVFSDLALSILIVRRRPRTVLVLSGLNSLLLLALGPALVAGLHEHAVGVLRATAAASALTAVAAVVFVLRLSGGRVALSRRWLAPSLAFSVPLIGHALAQWILQVSDRPVLAHYVSSSRLGVYYVGYSVGATAGLAVHGVSRALAPVVTGDLKADRAPRVVRLGTYWFGTLVVVCLAIALFGRDVLALVVGARFAGSLPVVPVVAAAHVAFAAYAIVSQGIWFSMRTRWMPVLTVAAGGLNVGLNVLLIPHFGIMAAAWDTVAGFAALALLNGVVADRLHRIEWEYLRWVKLVVAALAAYAVAQLAGADPSWPRLGLELVALLLVLPVALTALVFWDHEERALLGSRAAALRGRP